MAHSTMVPHATTIPTSSMVVNQTPIGTLVSSRPNPPLPPGYRALNPSVSNTTQVTPGVSGHFFPPRYNTVVGSIPTLSFGGAGIGGSNPFGGTGHLLTSGFQIPLGTQPHAREKPQFGGQPQIGTQPHLGGKPQTGVHHPLYG
jgi:hypothetical protein